MVPQHLLCGCICVRLSFTPSLLCVEDIADYCSRDFHKCSSVSILVRVQQKPPLAEPTSTHVGAVVDAERLHCPGQAQAHQDVKHITADGVGDGHVSHT